MRVKRPLAEFGRVGEVHVDDVVHRAHERQGERGSREPAVVREPHAVQAAQDRGQHQRPAQLLGNRGGCLDLLNLERHERVVLSHDFLVHGFNRGERVVLRFRPGPLREHREVHRLGAGYPRGVRHEHALFRKLRIAVKVVDLLVPEPRVGLASPVPFTRRPAKLKRVVHRVRLQTHPRVQPLRVERVPVAELRDGQRPHRHSAAERGIRQSGSVGRIRATARQRF
mmetsp:Transcript_13587/g.57525  ORF Transcript_13587/g.57525 Transcript_13587/m.57525 type:complete len:226 (-) Transcript_13587:929-1606(-)